MHLEEYHHYNSQKAGDPLWVVAPAGRSLPRALDTVRQGARVGGRTYLVTSDTVGAVGADAVLGLPDVDESLSPLLYCVPGQMFGYHVAMAKFARADGTGP